MSDRLNGLKLQVQRLPLSLSMVSVLFELLLPPLLLVLPPPDEPPPQAAASRQAAPASEPCLRYHLKRCPAPCRGDVAGAARERYAAAVEEVCSFLGGERAQAELQSCISFFQSDLASGFGVAYPLCLPTRGD